MKFGVYPTPKKGVLTCQGENHELLAYMDPLANVYLKMVTHNLCDMGNRHLSTIAKHKSHEILSSLNFSYH